MQGTDGNGFTFQNDHCERRGYHNAGEKGAGKENSEKTALTTRVRGGGGVALGTKSADMTSGQSLIDFEGTSNGIC